MLDLLEFGVAEEQENIIDTCVYLRCREQWGIKGWTGGKVNASHQSLQFVKLCIIKFLIL